MKLYIDVREPKQIIKYINHLNDLAKDKERILIEIKALDLGDYIIYDEKLDKNIIIIERKSTNDLEASIKDGRYNEQSFRLSENDTHNHNIYYLIEGAIINHKNQSFKNSLYSSLFSISYFKGFSVLNSLNNVESAEIIYGFVNKLMREKGKLGFYHGEIAPYAISKNGGGDLNVVAPVLDHPDMSSGNKELNAVAPVLDHPVLASESNSNNAYVNCIKSSKKSHITKENINVIMLMQIPNVSSQTATTIMNEYKTIKNLIYELEKNPSCLDLLKTESSNRKIGKNIIENIKQFLLDKDE